MEMQGSISNDLYSEILKLSSVELDRGSTAAQATDNLHEKNDIILHKHQKVGQNNGCRERSIEYDLGDLWYDDESSCEDSAGKLTKAADMDREWQRRHDQFHTIGYRDGLIAGKEAAAQEGFNIGFKDSVLTGYNWGVVRGITSVMACLPSGLKEKLVETGEARNKLQILHESVQSLSTTDALKLFYEDQKKKSSNQNESTQSLDATGLENYSIELQSIINESPLIEGHSKLN